MPEISEIYVYRMKHIDNIPHILQYGITHAESDNANNDYKSIGDRSLILNRNLSQLINGLPIGRYIPFYFGVRTPMLYVIQKGFNSVNLTAPTEIVYCVCNLYTIVDCGLDFVFTDGHASNSLTNVYQSTEMNRLNELLDWTAINAIYWRDENDTDKKRRKSSECLVAQDVPFDSIEKFVVYNQEAKEKLLIFGVEEEMIEVNTGYYF